MRTPPGPVWAWTLGIVVATVEACALWAFVAEGRFVGVIGLALTAPIAGVAGARAGGRARLFWIGSLVSGLAMLVLGVVGCEVWPASEVASAWRFGNQLVAIGLASTRVWTTNARVLSPDWIPYVLATSAFVPQAVCAACCGLLATRVTRPPLRLGRFRLRTSVRQAMAATAVLAVALATVQEGARLWNLRQLYLGQAECYGYWEVRVRGALDLDQEITYYSIRLPKGPSPSPGRREQMRRQAEYYGRMRAKYESAAAHPWRSVAPDPGLPHYTCSDTLQDL